MTPNQESSGSMPTSSEPVRVPVRLPLPVANLEVSDSILNIYIIYIRFHSKCSVLRIFYHHSRLKMLDWYKYIYIYIWKKNVQELGRLLRLDTNLLRFTDGWVPIKVLASVIGIIFFEVRNPSSTIYIYILTIVCHQYGPGSCEPLWVHIG